jgi:hypothetical protein
MRPAAKTAAEYPGGLPAEKAAIGWASASCATRPRARRPAAGADRRKHRRDGSGCARRFVGKSRNAEKYQTGLVAVKSPSPPRSFRDTIPLAGRSGGDARNLLGGMRRIY